MTLGQIHREFAAGRLTARQAADLSRSIRVREGGGQWSGPLLMAAVAASAYGLLLLALRLAR
jgi:hypothetical protein